MIASSKTAARSAGSRSGARRTPAVLFAILAGLWLGACGKAKQPAVRAPQADGTVASWRAENPMLTPRANHCAATSRGFLFVLGGNHSTNSGFVNIGTVDAAPVQPDGTLGVWQQAGMLPGPMSQCTATADDSHLYLVDAVFDDDASFGGRLWRADVAADGSVGMWTQVAPLPDSLRVLSQQAWVSGNRLIAMTSTADQSGMEAIELDLSNLEAGWTEHSWATAFRGWPQYAFTGKYAYLLGGYTGGDNTVVADGQGAAVSPDGSLGQPFSVRPLPQPTTAGDAAAVDGYVFLFGGKSEVYAGSPTAEVSSSAIGSDGTLASWNAQTPMPDGRVHLRATVVGDFVYVTGGATTSGGLDTVFSARVRF